MEFYEHVSPPPAKSHITVGTGLMSLGPVSMAGDPKSAAEGQTGTKEILKERFVGTRIRWQLLSF